MILEAAGIGLIIPFVQSLTAENINKNFLQIINFFNFYPSNKNEIIKVIIYFMFYLYGKSFIFDFFLLCSN